MSKIIVLTRLTVFDEDFIMYAEINEFLSQLNNEGHTIVMLSHSYHSLERMKSIFKEKFNFEITCLFRNDFKTTVDKDDAKNIIFIGSSDEDLYLTAPKKVLIINPGWSVKKGGLPAKYSITLESPLQLLEAIKIIANQNKWYFELDIDENTKLLALTSANTYNKDTTEVEILEGFQRLLKSGDRKYFNTLYFHLISGVMKNDLLREVGLWGNFPSSTGKMNEEIEELKERCRYLTGLKMKEPLFIRHTTVPKSHHTDHHTRLSEGCTKHFDSIHLNPYYSKRIKGKVVCVIDDYTTNGISFETARNLLFNAGAKKVILLALGRYKKGREGIYQYENYEFKGDITTNKYGYKLLSREYIYGNYDDSAREEVKRIYEILNK